MTEENIRIIHEPSQNEPFVVCVKPRGIPSAPLKEGDISAFSMVADLYPEVKYVTGKKAVEGGLCHRIDTDTEGLLLIASSQDFYDYLQDEQSAGRFFKGYFARCCFENANERMEGFPEPQIILENLLNSIKKYTISSKFRPFGVKNTTVRPVVESSGRAALKKCSSKIYSTDVEIINESKDNKNSLVSVRCVLTEGYRHQVRCHLAWIGLPITGDRLYNPAAKDNDSFEFYADTLSFTDPLTGKKLYFSYKHDV